MMEQPTMQPFHKIFKMKYLLLLLLFSTGIANAQVMPLGMMTNQRKVGDYVEGGIVFYLAPAPADLDGNGTVDKGLVCSLLTASLGWNNGSRLATAATAIEIGAGASNTTLIINVQGITNTYAARWARDFRGGGFTDWFLPSINELNELYINQSVVSTSLVSNGGTALGGGFTWSSSQDLSVNKYQAWQIWLMGGACPTCGGLSVKNTDNVYYVRAIRAF